MVVMISEIEGTSEHIGSCYSWDLGNATLPEPEMREK